MEKSQFYVLISFFVAEHRDVQDFKDSQIEQFYNAAAQLQSPLHAYSEATSRRF